MNTRITEQMNGRFCTSSLYECSKELLGIVSALQSYVSRQVEIARSVAG